MNILRLGLNIANRVVAVNVVDNVMQVNGQEGILILVLVNGGDVVVAYRPIGTNGIGRSIAPCHIRRVQAPADAPPRVRQVLGIVALKEVNPIGMLDAVPVILVAEFVLGILHNGGRLLNRRDRVIVQLVSVSAGRRRTRAGCRRG